MRVWRALKSLGCGILRDGVYVLPATASSEQALLNVAKDVIEVHGSAQVLELVCRSEAQTKQITALFDRSHDYAALLKTIHQTRRKTGTLSSALLRRTLHELSRRFTILRAIDFFPGAASEHAESALVDLEASLQSRVSPGEPLATRRAIQHLDKKEYQHQTWVTRKRPWVDRLASAWLICRFIDPHARFAWIDHPQPTQTNAIGFDFDGATFTHVGHRVTFEVLLATFALDADPALVRVGNLVHLLDVGGIPVLEAKGVETILRGLKEKFSDDDRFFAQACAVFDSLYMAYRTEETEP
ncbi:MAG TPA: chromate resistance protein ChrB domain-containing protein [Nitrospira sp.]|nr:chromate resistance protein ChrB domain-containing protein [Nitrospira sp.]